MKKLLVMLMVVAMASFLFVGCIPGVTPDPDPDVDEDVAVTGVTLDEATLALTVGDAAVTLVATVAPATATNTNVIWASSDKTVAIVAAGVVTPLNAGISAITVTTVDGGFVATCVVTVTAADEPEPVLPDSVTPVIEFITGINLYSSDTQYMNEDEVADGILVTGVAPKYSEVNVYVDDEVVGTSTAYGLLEYFIVFVAEDDLGDDGEKTIYATATEIGLAESAPSTVYAFTLDTVAPELVSVTAEAEDVDLVAGDGTGTGTITATFDEELDEDSAEVDVVDNWEVKIVGNPTFGWADEDEVSVELISPEVVGIEGDFTFTDELEEGDLVRVDYVGEELTDLAGNLADESFGYCYLEIEVEEEEEEEPEPNQAPVIASIPDDDVVAGEAFTYPVVAIDPDAEDVLTYSLTLAGPAETPAMGIDPDSGVIVWYPETAGTYVVIVTVTDVGELSANTSFEITVIAGALNYVKIEDVAGGGGDEVGDETMAPFDTLNLFAVGYDAYGNYVNDETVTWSVTGTLVEADLVPLSGTSTVFTPIAAGIGTITAVHASVTGDETGTITVE